MALLALQQATTSATKTVTYAAASGGGDTFALNRRAILHVRNGSGSAITVTLLVPGNTPDGVAIPDPTYSVPATTGEVIIGPFDDRHADPVTGLVGVTYSGVTSLTVALIGS